MEHTRITPDRITSLKDNEIFVFGSNKEGMHGGGAARIVYRSLRAMGRRYRHDRSMLRYPDNGPQH